MLAFVPFVICHAGHEYVQHMVHMRSNLASLCFAVHCCAAVRNHMVHTKCVLGGTGRHCSKYARVHKHIRPNADVSNVYCLTCNLFSYDKKSRTTHIICILFTQNVKTGKKPAATAAPATKRQNASSSHSHSIYEPRIVHARNRHAQRYAFSIHAFSSVRSLSLPVPVVRVPQMCHEYLRQNFHSMRLLFLV